jgi:hypothetical protein
MYVYARTVTDSYDEGQHREGPKGLLCGYGV